MSGTRHRIEQAAVPAGAFRMGDHLDEGYAGNGERPVHEVELTAYAIDATSVTNADFALFVGETGHVTDAERAGVSAVFHLALSSTVPAAVPGAGWWRAVTGAAWHSPEGPGSGLEGREDHPVVHVSWRDAVAYASWAGRELPTEAQWERAARGGLEGARFPWGDDLRPRAPDWECNIWQGSFPEVNTLEDGYLTTAPVRTFRPNGLGLWQAVGNVWEWCRDWYDPGYYAESPRQDPPGPRWGSHRVMRGGSYLCHDSYCYRYRVAARTGNTPRSASANLGFRTVGR